MRIIILSGLSGSGKSVALHMLEDLGFYCIDNIPAALLKPFISYTVRSPEATYERTAIGLDARNTAAEIATVPQLIDELRRSGIQCEVIFLVASDEELLRRFAETRRKHPMSGHNIDLREAMALERQLLEPIVYAADLVIDTSKMGVHALREIIHSASSSAPSDDCPSHSNPSDSNTASRVTRISCSTPARFPIPIGNPACEISPGATPK